MGGLARNLQEASEGDEVPSYRSLLEAPEGARAETWSWEWSPEEGLRSRDR
jgi:hypothetical protein